MLSSASLLYCLKFDWGRKTLRQWLLPGKPQLEGRRAVAYTTDF
jgi:hypothetical protein